MKTGGFVISLAVALLVWTTHARADDVNGAAKAFSQAQEAMLGGDAARAADLYELADELAPSAPALRNAARARLTAGHLAMAATNAAALLRRYPSDKESRDIAEAILSRLTPQLAQLEVTCTAACTLTIDGKAVVSAARTQHSLFTAPGARTIAAEFDGNRKATSQITAVPDHIITVQLEAPVRPAARPSPALVVEPARPVRPAPAPAGQPHGISRWWVIGGGAVTLGLGAGAAISGMATLSTRDQIRDATAAGKDGRTLYNTGRDQQIRTNLLLGATGVAAAGTVVLAFFANWSGNPETTSVAMVPASDSVSVVYGGHF
jgi:hypothetical protein